MSSKKNSTENYQDLPDEELSNSSEEGSDDGPIEIFVDLDELEAEEAQLEKDVNECLEAFSADLRNARLSDNTIGRHMGNAELYLNWLIHHEGYELGDAAYKLNGFLGNWFIRRCMWSNPSNIKTTAASLKKLLKSMADHRYISPADCKQGLDTIANELPNWQYKCSLYNDPHNEWEAIADEFDPWV